MASETQLASLSPPPDPGIGPLVAVVRQRRRRWLPWGFVLALALIAAAMAVTLADWVSTRRPPTVVVQVLIDVVFVLTTLFVGRRVWFPPPLVVGEEGFEARWTLRRVQMVAWGEVDSLIHEGDRLRVVLRDPVTFLTSRTGRRKPLFGRPFRYPSIPLNRFELPPDEVADVLRASFEAWKARHS